MKKFISIFSVLVLCFVAVFALAACDKDKDPYDYAGTVKLDTTSSRARMEVTVKTYIDGDTTHFKVPGQLSSQFENGVLKARYLGVDTPESTGIIEEYGKQASNFTKEKLMGADSVILESNDDKWNNDSTKTRYMVWVWYRTQGQSDYRCLNIELLQNGLAMANSIESTCYYEVCNKAYRQAIDMKLKMFSDEPDELFYYGATREITMKELRTNVETYVNTKVAIHCVVSERYDNGIYVEDYDEEDGIYYGMYVYYGFGLSGLGVQMLRPGSELRLIGNVQFYEAGNSYQIADLKFNPYSTGDDDSFKRLSQNNPVPYTLTSGATFTGSKTVTVMENGEEVEKEFKYAELVLGSSISMENLTVQSVYTTKQGNNKGAMTLTCLTSDGKTVDVRTTLLYEDDDSSKPLVTEDYFANKVINVKGVVDYYLQEGHSADQGQYQIKVSAMANITIQ